MVDENLSEAERLVRMAAGHGARLVVLPEMWTTSLSSSETYTDSLLTASAEAERRVAELGGELGLVIVGGGPARVDGRLMNRATVTDRGVTVAEYQKIHLFTPFGEDRTFDSGDEPVVVDTSVGRVGVAICYDIRFPELTRWYLHRRCEILAVPAQWPEARAPHWRILLKARAIENSCFVVGCNRTGNDPNLKKADASLTFPGDSRIIDPMGEVQASGDGENRPLEAEIDLRRIRTIRRYLPVVKDWRPEVYSALWSGLWKDAAERGLPMTEPRD